MDQDQDILSRSYTDSISSDLMRRHFEGADNNSSQKRRMSTYSSHSNNNNNIGSDTGGMQKSKSLNVKSAFNGFDERNKSRSHSLTNTEGGNSYYGSIQEDQASLQNSHDFDTEDEFKVTPLPKLQLFVIAVLLFSEPLTSTILFPFIYFMIKDFHLSDDEKEIGTYAGWITSMFFIAQFCTAIPWGRVSDRYGRRPVLLAGLIGNSISACLFGLSKNLWWAIGARAFCGIMNGNAGVARSMVSEITDDTNKAKAFALFGFCWGAGMIGPALGGYLARPAVQFPEIFGNCTFLIEYAYFLPCFVSAIGSFIGFIIGYMFLEESNPSVLANKKWHADQDQRLQKKQPKRETSRLLTSGSRVDEEASSVQDNESVQNQAVIPKSGSMRLISKTSYTIIAVYGLFGFHSMVYDEILPLYFTAPASAGGLGISQQDFAKTLSLLGLAQLLIQFVVYPRITQRFDTLVLCKFAFFLYIPCYLLCPELETLKSWLSTSNMIDDASQNWTFRAAYILLLVMRFFSNCLAYTGLGIMVSTSAAPEILGTINGINQSTLSLVRALAPTFGGTLWSISLRTGRKFPFDRHLVYYIITVMTILSLIQSYTIDKRVAIGGRKKRP